MERKTSSLRFTRGRLAALLSAVVLVTIVVFSLTFYHLCLHAKRMEVLTQGDGPLWAFEQGQRPVEHGGNYHHSPHRTHHGADGAPAHRGGRRHGLRRLRMPRHSPERRDHRSHG